jgi:UDP-2,3-diacylglucosamine pyrophosphatase LpxH
MRTVFLSDAHADGLGDPNQALLLRFLAGLEADALYILGDLFHRWWSFPAPAGVNGAEKPPATLFFERRRVFPAYVSVLRALETLVARGTSLTWLGGNHDFEIQRLASTQVHVTGPCVADIDGVRAYLSHGDELDFAPGARLTRTVLRGRLFAAIVDGLGPSRAWSFLGRLSGPSCTARPGGDGLAEKMRFAAIHRIREGARLVVFGHSHRPETTRVSGGLYVNLGVFGDRGSVLSMEQGRLAHLDPATGRVVSEENPF